jgi:nitroreductase
MKSAIKAIGMRRSCRSYDGSPLESPVREKVLEALARSSHGPFGNAVRLALVEPDGDPKNGSFGTYGFIRGARAFLAGLVRRVDGAYEDYGYCLEEVVLEATEWGLGTCWLGGTFRRDGFTRSLGAGPEDAVPAVTPIGRPVAGGSPIDALIKTIARSTSRRPWKTLFVHGDFRTPLTEAEAGRYAPCLECVRLAPSAANRQPWRVVKEDGKDAFLFFADRPPAPGKAPSDMRDIDLGIAMCHFALAARELGLDGVWERTASVPDAPWDPVARWSAAGG